MLYRLARRYFGNALVYCAPNSDKHCSCGAVPCVNPARTFAKNHDSGLQFGGGIAISRTERYLVQFRNPVRSLVSGFNRTFGREPERDTREYWMKHAWRRLARWQRFVDKWVIDFPEDAIPPFYCSYESLVLDPLGGARRVLAYLSDGPLDDEGVEAAVKRVRVEPRDSLAKFHFHDVEFFHQLEEAAADQIAALELPSFEASA